MDKEKIEILKKIANNAGLLKSSAEAGAWSAEAARAAAEGLEAKIIEKGLEILKK